MVKYNNLLPVTGNPLLITAKFILYPYVYVKYVRPAIEWTSNTINQQIDKWYYIPHGMHGWVSKDSLETVILAGQLIIPRLEGFCPNPSKHTEPGYFVENSLFALGYFLPTAYVVEAAKVIISNHVPPIAKKLLSNAVGAAAGLAIGTYLHKHPGEYLGQGITKVEGLSTNAALTISIPVIGLTLAAYLDGGLETP